MGFQGDDKSTIIGAFSGFYLGSRPVKQRKDRSELKAALGDMKKNPALFTAALVQVSSEGGCTGENSCELYSAQ